MEVDKSTNTSLATSTFLQASNHSICLTRAVAFKSIDFSLASGLPPTKGRPRRLKMGDKVVLLAPLAANASAVRFLQQIIDCHVEDFGLDVSTGTPLRPYLSPLCRLVHIKYVQSVQKVSEAVKSLKERVKIKGYCQNIGAKFYVQAKDAKSAGLCITKDIKKTWDADGKSRTRSSRKNVMPIQGSSP
jgi:hypothetical protein